MKRPTRTRQTSPASTSSSNSGAGASPRKRLRSASDAEDSGQSPIKVYIVQEKLDAKSIHELFDLIEHGSPSPSSCSGGVRVALELCSDPKDADVIVTVIRMKKRLERHVNWDIARQKAIVTPQWVYDSIKQKNPVECGRYAALPELHDETAEHCPESQDGQSQEQSPDPAYASPTVKPTSPRVLNNWKSRYACARASPLVCPNQALAIELGILGRSRELEGLSINALSYERSVAIIKSYPYLITKETYSRDVVKLPGLGGKTLSKIREFLKHGSIEESRTTRASQRFQALSAFTTIYGIGPSKARDLYDRGLRSIEDMERYYDVTPDSSLDDHAALFTPNGRRIPSASESASHFAGGGGKGKGKDKGESGQLPDLSVQASLVLRHELETPIPREEVEEMRRVVMRELAEIQPGCVSTIVGGYRRGKPQSNDVDIAISHRDIRHGADIIKGLCKKLTKRLHERGMVTHCMHLSGFHTHDALRSEQWDSLEKALTVFILPPSESVSESDVNANANANGQQNRLQNRLHRRLDLIFAVPEAYWTAVVGWSGSKMFERDLRLWAKTAKGMKFDSSGLTRRHDSKLFAPRSEEEVFSMLGLDWVDPTMRNADV